jgi:hypothetical protein
MGWAVCERNKLIPEIDIIGPEISASERGVVRYREACRPRASKGGIEGRANSQDASINIVAEKGVMVGRVPPDLYVILGSGVDIYV